MNVVYKLKNRGISKVVRLFLVGWKYEWWYMVVLGEWGERRVGDGVW